MKRMQKSKGSRRFFILHPWRHRPKAEKFQVNKNELESLTVLPSSFVILVILWTRQILLNMAP